MTRFTITFLCAFFLLGAKSPVQLAEHLAKSVTQIYMSGPNQKWGSCTAFTVNKNKGWGITAQHCVIQESTGFHFTVVDFRSRPLSLLAVAAPADDLALLQGEVFSSMPTLVALTIPPITGIEVGALGFAGGYGPPFFYFSTVARTHPTGYKFQLVGASEPGMSGSPVANRNGLVVGVMTKSTSGSTEVIGSWHFQELYGKTIQNPSPDQP